MEIQEGQLITPTLRLRKLLGKGGMGSVWLADHLSLQTQVAIKFLSPEFATSSEAIERFKREATAAAQIRSPHVVQTLDHGITASSTPYIVLELLEGEELGALMERKNQLDLTLVTRVVSQACKALAKAHAAGIIHRDIKPDNIFLVDVDGEPFVKVLDFGIAKKTGDPSSLSMTSTNAIIGTPYYMSPEQAFSSKGVDHRADLWALAVVVYFALTGEVPFYGETVGAICLAIDRATFKPVTQLRPDLPPGLDDWFTRALTRNIDRRFGSAREMADAFMAAIGEEAGRPSAAWSSRGDSNLPPAPKRARLPLILGLGGALVVAIGGLAIGLSRTAHSTMPPVASALPSATLAPTMTATLSATTTQAASPPTNSPPANSPTTPPTADSAPAASAAPKASAVFVPGRPLAGKTAPVATAAAPVATTAAPVATQAPTQAPTSTKVDRGF